MDGPRSPRRPGRRPAPRRRRAGHGRDDRPADRPRLEGRHPRPDQRRADAARLPRDVDAGRPPRPTRTSATPGGTTSACRTATSKPTLEHRRALAAVFRRVRPRLLFAPYWEDAHPDHTAATKLVEDARFWSKLSKSDIPGEPFHPSRILYYFSVHLKIVERPSFLVDVSDQHEAKLAALRCYRSQLVDNQPEGRPGVIDSVADRTAILGAHRRRPPRRAVRQPRADRPGGARSAPALIGPPRRVDRPRRGRLESVFRPPRSSRARIGPARWPSRTTSGTGWRSTSTGWRRPACRPRIRWRPWDESLLEAHAEVKFLLLPRGDRRPRLPLPGRPRRLPSPDAGDPPEARFPARGDLADRRRRPATAPRSRGSSTARASGRSRTSGSCRPTGAGGWAGCWSRRALQGFREQGLRAGLPRGDGRERDGRPALPLDRLPPGQDALQGGRRLIADRRRAAAPPRIAAAEPGPRGIR